MRIDKMTKEQAARFGEWSKKWIEIGLSTEPADFDTATEAALKAYKLCNLNRPMIVLRMGSPYGATIGGAIAWAMLREVGKANEAVESQVGSQVESQVESQVRSQVRSQVESQVESQVRSQVRSQVWSQVESQVRSQVESQVWSQVGSQVRSQVGSQVRSQVESQVRSQVESQVESQVRSQVESQVGSQLRGACGNYRGGQMWAAGWCGYVSFIRDVLGWRDPVLENFEIDEALTKSCGWVWWHENVLAISDRPSVIHRDDQGRLHCANGPSIAYRDGWALHHWHGMNIPEEKVFIITAPESITVKQIEDEANSELRRVMIDRYGAARYVTDSGAIVVHELAADHQLQGLRTARVLRKDVPDDEPIVYVDLLNSTPEPDGTTRRYMLRVDPGAYGGEASRNAHAAAASTWRNADQSLTYRDWRDYAPVAES